MESHGNWTRTVIFSTKLLNKDLILEDVDLKIQNMPWTPGELCFTPPFATDGTTVLGHLPEQIFQKKQFNLKYLKYFLPT